MGSSTEILSALRLGATNSAPNGTVRQSVSTVPTADATTSDALGLCVKVWREMWQPERLSTVLGCVIDEAGVLSRLRTIIELQQMSRRGFLDAL